MKKKQATRKRKQVIVFLVCGCKKPSFLTDDIQTFWHGARCDFVKKTDQRHPEGLMIKRPFYQTRGNLDWHGVLGKIWEFVFLVDDYHYTMTHSWGWVLSVRGFLPTIVLNSHQRLEFWKHQTVPTLSALPWFTPRIAVASFRRWRLPGTFSGSLFLEKKKKTMVNSGLLNNLTCPRCSTTVCTAEIVRGI